MIDYVEISTTGNIANSVRFDVFKINTPYPIPDTPMEWSQTLDGSSVQSFGSGRLVWDFECMVYYGETRVGWGNIASVYAIFAGTSLVPLKFRDWRNTTVYDAILTNKGKTDSLELISATQDAATSLYNVKFTLRQV